MASPGAEDLHADFTVDQERCDVTLGATEPAGVSFCDAAVGAKYLHNDLFGSYGAARDSQRSAAVFIPSDNAS